MEAEGAVSDFDADFLMEGEEGYPTRKRKLLEKGACATVILLKPVCLRLSMVEVLVEPKTSLSKLSSDALIFQGESQ